MTLFYTCLARFILLAGISAVPNALLAQNWQWATTPTTVGSGVSTVEAQMLDNAGNLVVTGLFSGTVTFGATTLTSAGNTDWYVARLNASGAWTQAVRANSTGQITPEALAMDPAGNFVVAGRYAGATATIGPFSLLNAGTGNTTDLFVARLSAAGVWTQAVRAGGPGYESAKSVAVDAGGTVVVSGSFSNARSVFGPFTLPYSDSRDLFVARLNSTGTWTQAVGVGSTGADVVNGMVLAPDGTVHVTGYFESYSVSFGPFTLANANTVGLGTRPTLFVASLSSAGVWTRATQTSGDGLAIATSLAIDAAGNLLVAGSFDGSYMRVGSMYLYNADRRPYTIKRDGFVAWLSNANVWTQAVRGGGLNNEQVLALAMDAQGNAVVTGYFEGATAEFGAVTLTNAAPPPPNAIYGTYDVFVARVDKLANWTHAVRAGGVGMDFGKSVLMDPAGSRVFTTGEFEEQATFGPVTLSVPGTGTKAPYIARLGGLPLGTQALNAPSGKPLAVFPNPAIRVAELTLLPANAPREALLVDAMGRQVSHQWVPAHATKTTLLLSELTPGVYVVRCGPDAVRLVVE